MEFIHKNYLEKWTKMPFPKQIANIGSEFFRAVSLREKGDLENAQKSALRVLDLINLTIEATGRKRRLFEIFRLKEVICDLFFGENIYKTDTEKLKNYFLNFALLK